MAHVGHMPYFVEYTFDLRLNLLDAHIADFVNTLHADLRMKGELDHRLSDTERLLWTARVVSFPTAPDGNGDETIRLMSTLP